MILIRYGEIALKTKRIRINWERMLVSNIKNMLKQNNIEFDKIIFLPTRGRIFLYAPLTSKISSVLKKVSGITSFSEVVEGTDSVESITELSIQLADKILDKNDTFAVRVKRSGSHNYSSTDIAKIVGGEILKNFKNRNISVDLSNPKKIIYIEIRDRKSYIFNEKIKGMGGLPIGVQGKIVSLISGGIDSPVAAWIMMKRGCYIRPIYFDNHPYLPKDNVNKVINVLKIIRTYDPRNEFYLYVIPHGANLKYFWDNAPSKYICLLCKRMMYRVSEAIARRIKAKALVTGENLGQVASQTLDNLKILDNTIDLPVFRPLLGFDKSEIIEIAKKIGTFQQTITYSASCKAVPDNPTIKGNLDEIIEIESSLDIDNLINNSIKNMKKILI
ncbi:MAG: tRNA uracil 4-sulfurtransferase ThiI [Candidatus Helarchaeota archaeon]